MRYRKASATPLRRRGGRSSPSCLAASGSPTPSWLGVDNPRCPQNLTHKTPRVLEGYVFDKGTEVGKASNRRQWHSRKHLLHLLTFPWNLPFWGSNTPDWTCPTLLQAHLSEAPCSPPCRHLLGVLISSRGISSPGPLPLSRIAPGCPPCHSESLCSFHFWGLVCPSPLCSSGDLLPLVFAWCGHLGKLSSCQPLQGIFPNSLGSCAVHGVTWFSLITPRSPIPLTCGTRRGPAVRRRGFAQTHEHLQCW